MKKSLSCTDLGVENCTFEARSEKKDEVKDAMLDHAQKYHPKLMSNLSETEKKNMVKQIESMIK